MPTVAVTGHMDLTETTVERVRAALDELLGGTGRDDTLIGVSCLAAGADTVFAEAVLDAGGALVVVLPSRDYRTAKVRPRQAALFDRLVAAASEVLVMPFAEAGPPAYQAANAELIARADTLVAVWDGTEPEGRGGGTADMVMEARRAGVPVRVVWPAGAERRG
ncbi:hypothetical protein ACFYZE_07300 [Streptomyces sp. NPDC001796]|uniref:hypothetical protein n=1 Tax=Streptomyces sp. NPDC001796 TaxID=3364609 RepID=UPI00368E6DD4